jgi:hypothetical protein
LNPLIGPKLSEKVIYLMAKEWDGNPIKCFQNDSYNECDNDKLSSDE